MSNDLHFTPWLPNGPQFQAWVERQYNVQDARTLTLTFHAEHLTRELARLLVWQRQRTNYNPKDACTIRIQKALLRAERRKARRVAAWQAVRKVEA